MNFVTSLLCIPSNLFASLLCIASLMCIHSHLHYFFVMTFVTTLLCAFGELHHLFVVHSWSSSTPPSQIPLWPSYGVFIASLLCILGVLLNFILLLFRLISPPPLSPPHFFLMSMWKIFLQILLQLPTQLQINFFCLFFISNFFFFHFFFISLFSFFPFFFPLQCVCCVFFLQVQEKEKEILFRFFL
jgi:hypothetical protein